MSYNQMIGQLGAAAPPNITQEIFQDALRAVGHTFDLYTRGTMINCDCFNETYKDVDHKCPECGGTGTIGGFTLQPTNSFLGFIQIWSEGNQDQHQRIYDKAGPIDTLDGQIFTEAKWWEIIHNDDVLVWKPLTSETGYELKIISKSPRYGSFNHMVFMRMDVTKNLYSMRPYATDIRGQI